MDQYDFLRRVVGCLEKLKIPYFITESVASTAYGEPRLTIDIDIVADIRERHISSLKSCFPEDDYYLEPEAAKKAVRGRLQFNIIHPSSGLKVDVIITKHDEFDASRFARVRRLRFARGREANYASPEDVIIKKLEYCKKGDSEKHLRDIVGILKVSGKALDHRYIAAWSKKFGVKDIWETLKSKTAGKE